MVQARVEGEDHLLRRAQQGDQGAFGRLVRIHQDEVFTLALRLLGNYDLATEAAQETFIRAWRALPNFRADAKLSTWLYRITVNTSWTVRKRSRRHQTAPLEAAAHLGADEEEGPVAVGERAELAARLSSAVEELPEGLRAVVVLKDVYGYSHAEVADDLSISVAAAKDRLPRARRRLRASLEGQTP